MSFKTAAALALSLAATTAMAAMADDAVFMWEYEGTGEDASFSIEDAIVAAGLTVSEVSHVGAMLDRTKEAVGATEDLYSFARTFGFCSATVSREVMAEDPLLVRYCPYRIFVYSLPDDPEKTFIGFENYPEGPMDLAEKLLTEIVEAAVEF